MALRTLLQAGCRTSRSHLSSSLASCSAFSARGFASEEKVQTACFAHTIVAQHHWHFLPEIE